MQQQPTKAAQMVQSALNSLVVETFTISGAATINYFTVASGDTLIINKGTKITVATELTIAGAKMENYGTLQVDGVLNISNDRPKNFQMPDFSHYNLNDPDDMNRFYNAYNQLLKRYSSAMSSQPGSKFENSGAIQGSGLLMVMGGSAITNRGSLKCYATFNEGKITNQNGSVDCLIFGAPISSAKNSSTCIVTFHLVEDSLLYATSVASGKAFSKVSNKDVQSLITEVAPWYSDKSRNNPWNYKAAPVNDDIAVYNSYM